MDTLAPAWQPDLPVSPEVEQAMQNLSDEIAQESEAEATLPWFLVEQAS